MRTRNAILVAALVWLSSTGCVYLRAGSGNVRPQAVPDEVAATFAYTRQVQPDKDEVIKRKSAYVIRRVQLPAAAGGDHRVTVDLYELPGPQKRPVIIVLPILGGGNRVANFFAADFARHGFAAAIIHRQEKYKDADDLDHLNQVFKQIVIDHKQALDWIATQPKLDADRIGLFGVSAGAVKGALVYALDKRIKAAALALVGGDLPYIFTYSSEKGIRRKRQKIMAEQSVTAQDIHDALKAEFKYDPLQYAPYMDASHTLLILACFDTVVPFKTGLELRDALGKPETMFIPTGHYTSIIYLPLIQSVANGFMQRMLKSP